MQKLHHRYTRDQRLTFAAMAACMKKPVRTRAVPLQVLRKRFTRVMREYFPGFARTSGRHWRVRCAPKGSGQGYCDDATRTVFIHPNLPTYFLDVVLIHELTHAVLLDGSHGAHFARRLQSTADRAWKLGHEYLAGSLSIDVVEQCRPLPKDIEDLYDAA